MGIKSGSRRKYVRTTVSLPAELLMGIDEAVESGEFNSRNELLADAVEQVLKRLRNEAIDRDILEMANDPELLAEEERIMKEFEGADREAWAMIDEIDGGWKE